MNYSDILASQKASISEVFLAEAQLKEQSDQRLEELRAKIANKLGRKADEIWSVYAFSRVGRILGLIQQIAYAPNRSELAKLIGLANSDIDLYFRYIGSTPYFDKVSKTIKQGRPMNVPMAREYIKYVGTRLGLIVSEDDLFDVTESNWQESCDLALKKAQDTMNSHPDMDIATIFDE